MKDAGVPDAIIPKAIAVLKKAIKIPYPYPYPKAHEALEAELGKDMAAEVETVLASYREYMTQCMKGGKTMKECAAAYKPNYPKAAEASTPDTSEIAQLRAELEATKRALDQRTEEEISGIVNGIKELDKEFAPDKFLEGITCKDLQKKVLQKYLETLKKHVRPIKLQIGEDVAKATVQKEVDEMFGKGATLEKILELKESGK
jgi:thiaminase